MSNALPDGNIGRLQQMQAAASALEAASRTALEVEVHAGALDRRDMNKHIFASALRLNETVSFGRVEPLHSTCRHLTLLYKASRRPNIAQKVEPAPRGTGSAYRRLNLASANDFAQLWVRESRLSLG